jgi:5-(carboxyamino)imidazole ribonucleotide mutase
VGIDRGENGAFLASQIIGIHDEKIRETVSSMRDEFFQKLQKDEENLLGKFRGSYHFPQSFDIQNNPKNEASEKFGENKSMKLNSPDVVVIVGSHSDMKVAKKTINFLDKMKISYDSAVISPVRYPEKFEKYLESKKDAKLFIAITGMSAHVTGAIAAHTEKPVIGVPCSIQLQGMDALLSMVDMPPGVPVATVGIDNGGNAAILAVEMLGIGNKRIMEDFMKFKSNINFKS